MASTKASIKKVGAYPSAEAEFERFDRWRAECSERLERMDDALIPAEFSDHVSHYRYARACALIDAQGHPETIAIAAVRSWLHSPRADD